MSRKLFTKESIPKTSSKNTALTLLCWAKDALAVLSSISKRNMPNMVVSMKAGDPPTGPALLSRVSLMTRLRRSGMKSNICDRKWNFKKKISQSRTQKGRFSAHERFLLCVRNHRKDGKYQ